MSLRAVVVVALLVVAVCGVPKVRNQAAPAVAVEPSEAMQEVVRPVVRAVEKMSPIDRVWLNGIYTSAAKVVQTDGVVEPHSIETTDGLQAVHVAILKFIWKGLADNPPGEYEGLKDAIDGAITSVIGDTRKPLTPELRKKAVEVFEAIAWAGTGKG